MIKYQKIIIIIVWAILFILPAGAQEIADVNDAYNQVKATS